MARLCVLREDLYLEWLAMAADDISLTLPNPAAANLGSTVPGLDDNGVEYRRVYFLRATLRTLTEVYSAVSALRNNQDFRKLYRNYSQQEYDRLVAYIKGLDRNLKELKRIRNALGGHVSKQGIERALDTMDFAETGEFEVGKRVMDTHYGFASTICGQIIMQDVPERRRQKHLLGITELNKETIDFVSHILSAYLADRKLI